MKYALFLALSVLISIQLSGCATILNGSYQDIAISSNPSGATVIIDTSVYGKTPLVAKLSRKQSHIVKLELPGFVTYEAPIVQGTSGAIWGNIIIGGLIGLAIDALSGGMWYLDPSEIRGDLRKAGDVDAYTIKDAQTFNSSYERVWEAALVGIKELCPIEESDIKSGVITTKEFVTAGSGLDKITKASAKEAALCTEKRIKLTFTIQALDTATTTIKASAAIDAYLKSSGIEAGEWLKFESNKSLEDKYIRQIEKHLK